MRRQTGTGLAQRTDAASAGARRLVPGRQPESEPLLVARSSGRKRFYTDTDILKLQKIRDLTRQRKHTDEIASALNIVESQPHHEENALSMLPGIFAEFDAIRGDLSHKVDRVAWDQYRQALKEYNAIPWWRRIFTRLPEPPE